MRRLVMIALTLWLGNPTLLPAAEGDQALPAALPPGTQAVSPTLAYGPVTTDFLALRDAGFAAILDLSSRPKPKELHGLKWKQLSLPYQGGDSSLIQQLIAMHTSLPQPVFLAGDDGRSRGPTAAALLLRQAGRLQAGDTAAWLEKAGVRLRFRGLFALAAMDIPNQAPDKQPVAPDKATPDGNGNGNGNGDAADATFARQMAIIGEAALVLDQQAEKQWQQADRASAAANRLSTALTHLLRQHDRNTKPSSFHVGLWVSASRARGLRRSIHAKDWPAARRQLKDLQEACTTCHMHYRN